MCELDLNECVGIAEEAAREAGEILMKRFGKVKGYQFKRVDDDPEEKMQIVTEVDVEAEEVIKNVLQHYYPNHFFYSEESCSGNRNSEYVWCIDPLCGTKAYVTEFPSFNVSIAMCYKGEPVVGVVYAPYSDEMFTAIKDGGAYLNGEKLMVSDIKKIETATLSLDHRLLKSDKWLSKATALFNRVHILRCVPNCGLEMAYVAAGRVDALIKKNQPAYDYAAGLLLIREAGGRVTDFDGNEIRKVRMDSRVNFVASNGKIHDEIIRILKG